MNFLRRLFQSDQQEFTPKRPPILYKKTQVIIKQLANFYDGDILTYWLPVGTSITPSHLKIIFEAIKQQQHAETLYFFVKSGGGSGKAALRIIHLLRQIYKRVVLLAPMECASAATMLALGADTIKMGPLAYFTATDGSINHSLAPVTPSGGTVSVNQNELERVVELWKKEKSDKDKNPYSSLFSYVHPLVFGAVDRAHSLAVQLTSEILSYHLDDKEKIAKISHHFNANYPTHSYPITAREAQAIGLNIEPLEPQAVELLSDLTNLYSEMAQFHYSDYNEYKYHDNQISTIVETANCQIFYQTEKDMIYRSADGEVVPLNDYSSWRKATLNSHGQLEIRPFYVR